MYIESILLVDTMGVSKVRIYLLNHQRLIAKPIPSPYWCVTRNTQANQKGRMKPQKDTKPAPR